MKFPGADEVLTATSANKSPGPADERRSVNVYNLLINLTRVFRTVVNSHRHNGLLDVASIAAEDGLEVSILNLGATITSLKVPTGDGKVDTVLSYPMLDDYLEDPFFMGATVGPFANRLRDGRFVLDGHEYQAERNEVATGHSLHSGEGGLHRQFFEIEQDASESRVSCRLSVSDGAGGFPGNREITIVYQIVNRLGLVVDYRVSSDRNTLVSLANHAYFNLGGPVDDCDIYINADAYTPVDQGRVPTGEIRSVAGSRFDLREPTRISGQHFDHNFVLNGNGHDLSPAATLVNTERDLQLDLSTTQPGLQFLTGDNLDSPFRNREGICLEAQSFPDAPNQPAFPPAHLAPGGVYKQRTVYQFGSVTL